MVQETHLLAEAGSRPPAATNCEAKPCEGLSTSCDTKRMGAPRAPTSTCSEAARKLPTALQRRSSESSACWVACEAGMEHQGAYSKLAL